MIGALIGRLAQARALDRHGVFVGWGHGDMMDGHNFHITGFTPCGMTIGAGRSHYSRARHLTSKGVPSSILAWLQWCLVVFACASVPSYVLPDCSPLHRQVVLHATASSLGRV